MVVNLKRIFVNHLKFIAFMIVVICIISAVLFTYVPADEVRKTVGYIARDLVTPSSDIVIVYPTLSNFSNLTTFSVSNTDEIYSSEYVWSYDGQVLSYKIDIPREMYEYYSDKSHDRRDYEQYAVSDYDREIIQKIAKSFAEHGQKNNYSDEQIALNVIAFSKTISYQSDLSTTGLDEYPRYPVETLIDGGDCEDLSILATAVLYELGQETILVRLENHMGIGIKDNGNFSGVSYLYNDTVYYYAGLTDGEPKVGIISDSINPTLKQIYSVYPAPKISGNLQQYAVGIDGEFRRYVLRGTIKNDGPGVGKNIMIRTATELSNSNDGPVADILIPIGDIPEDHTADVDITFSVPRGSGLIKIQIEGDNFNTVNATGFYFSFW